MIEAVDILLWGAAILWTVFLVMGIINALLVPNISRLRLSEPHHWPSVSFVVPARNEERDIREAVTSFCAQDYPGRFEVIVVNDRSTDGTSRILVELQARFSNLTVLESQDPPMGWFGKPNAMEIGRRHAQGEWILAADADVVHAPDLLRRAIAYSLQENVGMLGVWPQHVTGGILEAALMSAVTFFWFVATPMFLVRYSRRTLFAAGAGAFNLFRRGTLEACGGFACIRQAVLDDVEIGAHIKRAGHRVGITFSGVSILHRMYPGAGQVVEGYSKNTFPSIRKAPWLLPLYFLAGTILSILPYCAFAAGLVAGQINIPAAICLVLMHLVFAGIAWRYGEPWYITFLNPVREVGWFWIFTRSFLVYRRSGLVWRGRIYQASPGRPTDEQVEAECMTLEPWGRAAKNGGICGYSCSW